MADFKLIFGIDIEELVTGLTAATEAVQGAALEMKESLTQVSEAFAALGEAALAITGIMAGGKAFGEMISSTVNLNYQSMELGKQFGISASQASQLRVALNSAFLTQDQFSSAGQRITRTLNTNEEAFSRLGIATRDSNGNFRSTLSIMLDANTKLASLKEGTDRNIAGMQIYGRSWTQLQDIIRLTSTSMAEAREEADALGLTVTDQSLTASLKYKSAMVDVQEVLEGVSNAIGQALLPMLTEFGEWIRSEGPSAVGVFRIGMEALNSVLASLGTTISTLWHAFTDFVGIFNSGIAESFGGAPLTAVEFFTNVLRVVEVAFIGLRVGVQLTVQVIENEFEYLEDLVYGWANVVERAFHLDWAGVQAAWKAGNAKIEADEEAHFQKLVNLAQKGQDDINAALLDNMGKKPEGTETPAPTGNQTAENQEHQNQILQRWEAELEQDKLGFEQKQLLQGTFEEFSKEQEAAFWEAKLATGAANAAQSYQIERKLADLKLAMNKQAFDTELGQLKSQEAEYSKAAGERIAIAEKEASLIAAAYGKGSPQFEAAQKHLIEVQTQANTQLEQMAEAFEANETARKNAEITAEDQEAQRKYSAHLISANQLEKIDLDLENRRTEIERQGIQQRLSLIDPVHDPVAYAKLCAQLEGLEQTHQQRMTQIQQQAVLNNEKVWQPLFQQMQSGFTSAINNMLKGTATFQQGMQQMCKAVLDSIIDFLAKWVVQWAATQIENMIASKTTAAAQVQTQVGIAGASGVASFAGAPWPIDIGAPAFGAAMAGEAASFGVISAEGGYDIPAGLNPQLQAHAREMVLPSPLADVIRGLAEGRGKGGGGGLSLSVKALDGRSVERVLDKNSKAVERIMTRIYGRNSR